jgi:hypothetical protein
MYLVSGAHRCFASSARNPFARLANLRLDVGAVAFAGAVLFRILFFWPD